MNASGHVLIELVGAVAILAAIIWFVRARRSAHVTEEADASKAGQAAVREKADFPDGPDRLLELARDFSDDNEMLMTFVTPLLREGSAPNDTQANWLVPQFYDLATVGPHDFGGVVVQALTTLCSKRVDKTPMVYLDWKEDVEDAAMQFDTIYRRLTGREPIVLKNVRALSEADCFAASGPEVATAFARDAFEKAGYKLMELQPPGGWDAYLFAAIPKSHGKRWNLVALKANGQSPKNSDIRIADAYFVAAEFIEEVRPEGVGHFENKTGPKEYHVFYYWDQR